MLKEQKPSTKVHVKNKKQTILKVYLIPKSLIASFPYLTSLLFAFADWQGNFK